jgi:hypothetical protein
MSCRSCSSEQSGAVWFGDHHPFLRTQESRHADRDVFPKILVCLECGVTEFTVPELRLLGKGQEFTAA